MTEFSRWLEAEIPALRRYARRLRRNPADADDLVQACLERAFAKRRLWRMSGSLRAWLFTMMRNLHANETRSRSRRPEEGPLDPESPAGPRQAEAQVDHVMVKEVLAALGSLDDTQREVLILVAVDGLSYAEVAGILDVPLGTVMSRLARGRERLRRLLAGGDTNGAPTLRRIK